MTQIFGTLFVAAIGYWWCRLGARANTREPVVLGVILLFIATINAVLMAVGVYG